MKNDLKQQPKQTALVLPDEVEEEARIKSIEFYRPTYLRLALFCVLAILSGGSLFLLCKWKDTLAVKIMGTKCKPNEARFLIVFGADGTAESVSVKKRDLCLAGKTNNYRCFTYRLYTYYYDISGSAYKPVQFEIKDKTYEEVVNEFGVGILSSQTIKERLMTYGKNSTDIKKKSNIEIFIDEISSPFYIFQAFAIVFWAKWNDYFVYAMIILGISVFTIACSCVKTKLSLKKLYARAHYEIDVTVLRGEAGKTGLVSQVIKSSNLVPGDIIEIPFNKKMPCDIILLTGTCVMNESMLTGESIPVIKQHITKSEKAFNAKTADQYLLYSGTECLEARRANKDTPVTGFILRTGFDTMKGRLVRSFLYSKPENFKFYRDSVKYIGAMAVVAIICFLVGIKSYRQQKISAGEYVIHCLEIITCAVPPALPTCLAVGTAMAASRLEKKKIITKTELKINVAGRVKTMCFDKTGTLTSDSLDLFGVRGVKSEASKMKFNNITAENIHSSFNAGDQKSTGQKMLELMATCHALTYVRGAVSGDPLDLRMFEATKWNLKENEEVAGVETTLSTLTPPQSATNDGYYKTNSQVEVIKRFDFVAKLQRMSAIVKDPQESKQRVYVKGSPEVLTTLCRPETVPEDFTKTLLKYTQSGLRVIACATRLIDKSITSHSQVERDSFENDLEFLGFLIFENKLKEVTPAIIQKLKDADVDTMMLTGDNPLTAIFVARDCAIVEKDHRVVLGSLVSSEANPQDKKIEWRYIEKTMNTSEVNLAKDVAKNQVGIEMVPLAAKEAEETVVSFEGDGIITQTELEGALKYDRAISIALTGEATNFIASTSEISEDFRKIIFKRGKVFARMRPDDKAFIVEKLQSQGHIVGMCGDGANDCPALKVANVGIALSEAEASLAAPFMSRITDISSVDIVLREGRTALVTSFQCFKFMSIYALIQTFNIAILNTRVSSMTNGTFLYEDLYAVLPLCLTMGMTGPTKKLSKERPTENLLSAEVLLGMFGQCIIQLAAQVIGAVILSKQYWYKNPSTLLEEEGNGDENATVPDWDLSVVFLIASFQFFSTVMTFSVGKPFRKPFYTNWVFTLVLIYTTASSLILILIPIPALIKIMGIRNFEGHQSFRWVIFAIVIVNGMVTYCYERFGVPAIIFTFSRCFRRPIRQKKAK